MNSTDQIYNKENCLICLVDYKTTEVNECLLLKCGHIFHESCAKTWIDWQHNCPSCRSKAITPLSMSDLVQKAAVKAFSKEPLSILAIFYIFFSIFGSVPGCLNGLSPGYWPTTPSEELTFPYMPDFRRSQDNIQLEIFIFTTLTNLFFMMLSKLSDKRNEMNAVTAKKIDYIPKNM